MEAPLRIPNRRTPDGRSADPNRWDAIVRQYESSVRAYGLSLTRDHHQAADLTQEVLIRAHRAPDHPADKVVRAWLGKVTLNLFIDEYRRRQRHQTVPLPSEPHLLSSNPAPDELSNHLDPQAQAALLQLPHHQRQAVVLRDLFDFSYAQIAHHTQTPEGTVRSRISRGRTTLAELLDPAYGRPRGPTVTGRRQVPRPSSHRGER